MKEFQELEKQQTHCETSLKEIKQEIQKQIENKEKLEKSLKAYIELKKNISNKIEQLKTVL